MKKLVTLLVFIAFVSCKSDKKEQTKIIENNTESLSSELEEDVDISLKNRQGDFVYYADAAVFQQGNDIYGVVLDEKVDEIAKQAKAFQKEPTDMVSIEVLGSLIEKDSLEEGWPFKLKISKIVNVSALEASKNDVIKLGN